MKQNRKYLLIGIGIASIVLIMNLTEVKGMDFDVGDPVYASDLDSAGNCWYYFDSGSTIGTNPALFSYIPSILDGNPTTGLDHDFGSGASSFQVFVEFPYDFFVKNITVDPVFNGGFTKCYFGIVTKTCQVNFGNAIVTETTFRINGILTGFYFMLIPEGETRFYFNDIIVEYEPRPSNIEDLFDAFDDLSTQVSSIESQLISVGDQLSQIQSDINLIKDNITNLESDLLIIQSDIDDLWTFVYDLSVLIEGNEDYINLVNTSLLNSIEILKINISNLENDIQDILDDLEIENPNEEQISQLLNDLNLTIDRIDSLENGISNIMESIPDPYDDTSLLQRLETLESDNNELESKIENLTTEIDKLQTADTDEDNMKTNNMISFIGIGTGVAGILMALTALILMFIMRKGIKQDVSDTKKSSDIRSGSLPNEKRDPTVVNQFSNEASSENVPSTVDYSLEVER